MKNSNSILFVCLGNICRSPLAEGLMRKIQSEYGLNFDLDSAGTNSYHTGEAPDPRTRANAIKHGVDISDLRARTFVTGDLERFQQIYVMDKNNLKDVLKVRGAELFRDRVKLLPHPEKKHEVIEIPDPYYGGEQAFEDVFQLLSASVHTLCRHLSHA